MLRLCGAVLIISGSVFWAAKALSRLKGRILALEALISSLEMLRGEICTRLSPICDACELLSRDAAEPACYLYERVYRGMESLGDKSFNAIWRDACSSSDELRLTEDELLILCDLGSSLGRYDVEEQKTAISRTVRILEAHMRKAEEERRRDGRVHAAFPIVAGLFAVIILL